MIVGHGFDSAILNKSAEIQIEVQIASVPAVLGPQLGAILGPREGDFRRSDDARDIARHEQILSGLPFLEASLRRYHFDVEGCNCAYLCMCKVSAMQCRHAILSFPPRAARLAQWPRVACVAMRARGGFRSANGAYYNPLAGRARRASDGAAPVYG